VHVGFLDIAAKIYSMLDIVAGVQDYTSVMLVLWIDQTQRWASRERYDVKIERVSVLKHRSTAPDQLP